MKSKRNQHRYHHRDVPPSHASGLAFASVVSAVSTASGKKHRKWRLSIIAMLTAIMIVGGVSAASYPTVANWFSELASSKVIKDAVTQEDNADPTPAKQLAQAHAYNEALDSGASLEANERKPVSNTDTSNSGFDYYNVLSVGPDHVMGRLKIPKIKVDLPIYHGTSDEVLEKGVGHLEGTSLPVGGKSTRAVLSAHRGLAGATLFTHLDKITKGDRFTIVVLGKTLTYQVISTQVVDPDDTEALKVVRGQDLVTLVTCTPLGINSSRILVTGKRVIPTPEKDIAEANEDPHIPEFPWWIIWMSATIIGAGIYVWRMGYDPKPRSKSDSEKI